ncbi:glycoside hydrolase family 32 protein [Allocoprobacillus halotolerans]|uniref:beta-fructofuranosidase n=1 Tax=Allocoprobacillus halotolerans TaxID=2944914 RepID=A0ABY5I8L3_9FIRM|nr:glycoside hydrolase family 32 protein [Allocoprobacillus halotolerans]UTY40606.1 glycoside hydrolase family 32 protein [Allocoprobacillus halotolerans]
MKPKIHFTAPYHWINDPNGLIYYQGNYHIFYQHFPYENFWGTMHWGHATSKDLLHFKHHPIALYPSCYDDRNGCFSGSAIEKDGKMYLYYTAIRYAKENPEYVHVQYSDDDLIASQYLMVSDDGFHFDHKSGKQKIIDVMTDPQLGDIRHTRDPKVWKMKNGKYGLIIGSKIPSDTDYCGEVLLYESEDAIHFTYKNRYKDDSIGNMWECPDLIEIKGQYFMIFSPEHFHQPKPDSVAIIMPVSFDEETMTITKQGDYMYLDYGLDLYAPQTFFDENHQRTMLAWMRMREPIPNESWIGLYILPRQFDYRDGHVYQMVHPHINQYFNQKANEVTLSQPFYMHVKMHKDSQIDFGGMKLYIQDDCLCCDRQAVSIQHEKVCNINKTPVLNGQYDLEIYYDYHIFEIFINGGYYVLSQVVYDLKPSIHYHRVEMIEMKLHSRQDE